MRLPLSLSKNACLTLFVTHMKIIFLVVHENHVPRALHAYFQFKIKKKKEEKKVKTVLPRFEPGDFKCVATCVTSTPASTQLCLNICLKLFDDKVSVFYGNGRDYDRRYTMSLR